MRSGWLVKPRVRADVSFSEVAPPQSLSVEAVPRVVLYAPDGTPMVRQIGFAMQTSGTNPPLSDGVKKTGSGTKKPKGKK